MFKSLKTVKPFIVNASFKKFVKVNPITAFHTNRILLEQDNSKSSLISEVKDFEEFSKAISSTTPVVVDFYASWCGPCKLLTPKLEEETLEHGKYPLIKVNIDQISEAAQKYQISSIPTVMAFHKGEPIASFMGFQNNNGIKNFFKSVDKKLLN